MGTKASLRASSTIRKTSAIILSLGLLTTVLAACSKGDGSSASDQHVLRLGVLYSSSDSEESMRQQYTDSYELQHPGINIQITAAINSDDFRFQDPNNPTQQPNVYEKLKDLLTGNNPVDVIILDTDTLKRSVQDNLLKQLDPLIQESKFDIDDFVPTVIDGIKDAGDGNLYALAPTFHSTALYYNKKMFADAGVPVPTDKMQWNDVFDLARRVTTGEGQERKFGFSFSRWVGGNPLIDAQNIAKPLQLKEFDNKGEKMMIDTPQWTKLLNEVVSLYKDKVVPTQSDVNAGGGMVRGKGLYNPFQGDMFINGRSAMMIAGNDYVNELSKARDYAAKNNNIGNVDWDVVTLPTFAEAPGVGGDISLNNLMAINAKAQNPDDAWDFIQYNNSKEWAKLKSRSTYEMVSRKSFLKPKEGMDYNLAAFYTLKPGPLQDLAAVKLHTDKPNISQVDQLGQNLFQAVADGKITVEQAINEWQTQGDAFLQRLKDDPTVTLDLNAGISIPRGEGSIPSGGKPILGGK